MVAASELVRRISDLPCFKHVLNVEALTCGLTNESFKVTDSDGVFVTRFSCDIAILGISREIEVNCHKSAAALGITPEIVFSEPGVLVYRYVDGETLTPETAGTDLVLEAVVDSLKILHNPMSEPHGRLFFVSPYHSIVKHARAIREHRIHMRRDLEQYMSITSKLYDRLPASTPSLCHADLVGENIVFDGTKAWLIDWEYGGIGDPHFDLGWFSVASELSVESCHKLLRLYYGRDSDERFGAFNDMRILCALRDALWGVVQTHNSSLDNDYQAHAEKYFAVFDSLLSSSDSTDVLP